MAPNTAASEPTNEEIANEIADRLDVKWGATDDNLAVVMDVFETLYEAGYQISLSGTNGS